MKAAIYCRLSKEDAERETESESIQNQKSMLIHYALDHGFDICAIYCDEDYSGIDRARPDFNRMLEAARAHKFDVILAKTQSRFTRDMELVEKYLHGKFPEWGIRFIAVVDHVDTDDLTGKKSRQINGLINEWYLEDLSHNVRAVLDHKRRQGQYIASFALYGYRKDPANKNHLLIDEEAAAVVRRIFALYLAGSGTTRIARLLNEEGVPPPSRYRQEHGGPAPAQSGLLWSRATLHHMLRNRTYAGDLEQGRRKKISYKSARSVALPPEQWIVVPGTHEAIIDRDTFEAVQRMLARPERSGSGGTVHPLAGRVFCGLCGTVMEQTGGGHRRHLPGVKRYFRCRMAQRDPARCAGQPYLPADELETVLRSRIRTLAEKYAAPDSIDMACRLSLPDGQDAARRQELERLRREAARRRRALEGLYLDRSDGLLDAAQYLRLRDAYQQELDGFEARAALLERQQIEAANKGRRQALLAETLRRALAVETLTRELTELLLQKVVVWPPAPEQPRRSRQIDIYWRF